MEMSGLKILLDGASSCTLEEWLDVERCESESLEWVKNSGEAGGGSVNKYSGGVGNIHDNNNLAQVLAKVYVCYSAWLYESSEHLLSSSQGFQNLPFLQC